MNRFCVACLKKTSAIFQQRTTRIRCFAIFFLLVLVECHHFPGVYQKSRLFCFTFKIVGTALLLCFVAALTDPKNNSPPKNIFPITIGQLIFSIGLSYGYNCGFALNPARDLGPRIFTAVAGWGIEPFRYLHLQVSKRIYSCPHFTSELRQL